MPIRLYQSCVMRVLTLQNKCLHVLFFLVVSTTCTTITTNTNAMAMSMPTTTPKIEYVAGQRCLWTPQKTPQASSASVASTKSTNDNPPPVVILGGMAQSIASWEHHVPSFAQSRSVLLYECRGQGPPHEEQERSQDYLDDVSLPAQASYLMETLDELLPSSSTTTKVDLVGFSLGGRIALATALKYPHRIRKIHITGVAADRSTLGHLTVASWKDHIHNHNNNHANNNRSLRSFAWSILLATYTPSFLKNNWQDKGKLSSILDFVAAQSTAEGLTALLEQTHQGSFLSGGICIDKQQQSANCKEHEDWSTLAMARRFQQQQKLESSSKPLLVMGHACVGSLDQDMAPVHEVERLCQMLGWDDSPTVIPNCGHAVPMEEPRLWRNGVLQFLDAS